MAKWLSLNFVKLRWQYLSFTLFLQRYICFDAKLTHHRMSLCDEIRAVWAQTFLYRDSFSISISILTLFDVATCCLFGICQIVCRITGMYRTFLSFFFFSQKLHHFYHTQESKKLCLLTFGPNERHLSEFGRCVILCVVFSLLSGYFLQQIFNKLFR